MFLPTLEGLALESSGVAKTNSVGGGVLRDPGISIPPSVASCYVPRHVGTVGRPLQAVYAS